MPPSPTWGGGISMSGDRMAKFKDIVSEWDGGPVDSVVCVPVSRGNVPVPFSSMEHCVECQQEVWLAPSSHAVLEKYPGTPIKCLDCLMEKVRRIKKEKDED